MFGRLTAPAVMLALHLVAIVLLGLTALASLVRAVRDEDWLTVGLELLILPTLLGTVGMLGYAIGRARTRRRLRTGPPRISRVGPNRLRVEHGPADDALTVELTLGAAAPDDADGTPPYGPPSATDGHSWMREHRN